MTDETQERTVISEVTVRYTRSAFCRVIHADGAWGGLTPQGNIQMALYSEKVEIPELTTYEVLGQAGSPMGSLREKQVVQRGHNREVEVEVILSPAVAMSLRDWLQDKLDKLQAIQAKQPATP